MRKHGSFFTVLFSVSMLMSAALIHVRAESSLDSPGRFAMDYGRELIADGVTLAKKKVVKPSEGVSPIPEPTSIILLCTGLAAVGVIRRKKRSAGE